MHPSTDAGTESKEGGGVLEDEVKGRMEYMVLEVTVNATGVTLSVDGEQVSLLVG